MSPRSVSARALAYRGYSRDYVAVENEARRAKRGMWRGTFVKPAIAPAELTFRTRLQTQKVCHAILQLANPGHWLETGLILNLRIALAADGGSSPPPTPAAMPLRLQRR